MNNELNKSRDGDILRRIAAGKTYAEICRELHCALSHIFDAAARGAELCDRRSAMGSSSAAVREVHPRAYLPWTSQEERELLALAAEQQTVGEIAAILERQPSAISSRLHHLAVNDRPTSPPQEGEAAQSAFV